MFTIRQTLMVLVFSTIVATLTFGQNPPAFKPLTTYRGHSDPVYAVAVSPEGQLVATGSFDQSVRLWAKDTGTLLRTYAGPSGHTSLVLAVDFHPKGDQIASAGADNTVRLWDVPRQTPNLEQTKLGTMTRVAGTADGKQLIAGMKSGQIKLLNPTIGEATQELRAHAAAVQELLPTPSGNALWSVAADQTIQFQSLTKNLPAVMMGAGTAAVKAMQVHPSIGAVLTLSEDGVLRQWASVPTAPRAFPKFGNQLMALSPDG
ncbi:MAG: WD40 repeat domain-containing protein, partial [Gemmataceae bacterium]